MPTPMDKKTITVEVFMSQLVASKGDASNWTWLELDLGEAEMWGPKLEFITAHAATQGATANHQWKVVFWYSIDGKNWYPPSTPVDLFSAITSGSVYAVQTPYTTTANFGLRMRFAVGVKNSSGTATETAVCSLALVFGFRS